MVDRAKEVEDEVEMVMSLGLLDRGWTESPPSWTGTFMQGPERYDV